MIFIVNTDLATSLPEFLLQMTLLTATNPNLKQRHIALPDKVTLSNSLARENLNSEFTREKVDKELHKPKNSWDKFKDLAIKYAGIIDSRESTYRAVLDLVSSDFPTLLSNATRGFANFMEATIEGLVGTATFLFAPFITKTSANIAAKFIFAKEELGNVEHYLRFHMPELRDEESFAKGLERIRSEEAEDQHRIAKLYNSLDKQSQVEKYKTKAQEIETFCNDCSYSPEKIKKIYQLKKSAILMESGLEGGFWGAFGLILRLFRKYVMGQNRFTGTSKYINDEDSKKIGEASKLSPIQKVLGTLMIPLSPIVNSIFLKLTKDSSAVKNSKVLSSIEKNIDMTHGVFPKLGLMFTYSSMPKWLSAFIGAQGNDERLERLAKFLLFIPSWWLGHRVTNGVLAAKADKKLAEKYGVERGILVEKDQLDKTAPEPARIHHVMKVTEGNDALQEEAIKEHAKVLYAGFGLHSLAMLGIFFGVNFMTKIRTLSKLKKVKEAS